MQYQYLTALDGRYIKDYSYFTYIQQLFYFKPPYINNITTQEYSEDDQLQKKPPSDIVDLYYVDTSIINKFLKPKKYQNYVEENFQVKSLYVNYLKNKPVQQPVIYYNEKYFSGDIGLNYLFYNLFFNKEYFEPTPLYFETFNAYVNFPKQLYLTIVNIFYLKLLQDKYYQIVNSDCPYKQIKYLLTQIHNTSSAAYRKVLSEYIIYYYINEFFQCSKTAKFPWYKSYPLIPYVLLFFQPGVLEKKQSEVFLGIVKYLLKSYKKYYAFVKNIILVKKFIKLENYYRQYTNKIFVFYNKKIKVTYDLKLKTVYFSSKKYFNLPFLKYNYLDTTFIFSEDYKIGRYDILLFKRKEQKTLIFIDLQYLNNYFFVENKVIKKYQYNFLVDTRNLKQYFIFFRKNLLHHSLIYVRYKYRSSNDFVLLSNKVDFRKIYIDFFQLIKYFNIIIFSKKAPFIKVNYIKERKIVPQTLKEVYKDYFTIKISYSRFTEYDRCLLDDFYNQMLFNLDYNFDISKIFKIVRNKILIKLYVKSFNFKQKTYRTKITFKHRYYIFKFKDLKHFRSVITTNFNPILLYIEHKKLNRRLYNQVYKIDFRKKDYISEIINKSSPLILFFNILYTSQSSIIQFLYYRRQLPDTPTSYYINKGITYNIQYSYYLYIDPYSFQYYYNLQNFGHKEKGKYVVNDFLKKQFYQINFSNPLFNILERQISYVKKYTVNSFYSRLYTKYKDIHTTYINDYSKINYQIINKLTYKLGLYNIIEVKKFVKFYRFSLYSYKELKIDSYVRQKSFKKIRYLEKEYKKYSIVVIAINTILSDNYKKKDYSKVNIYNSVNLQKIYYRYSLYLKMFTVYKHIEVKITNYNLSSKQKSIINLYLNNSIDSDIRAYYMDLFF